MRASAPINTPHQQYSFEPGNRDFPTLNSRVNPHLSGVFPPPLMDPAYFNYPYGAASQTPVAGAFGNTPTVYTASPNPGARTGFHTNGVPGELPQPEVRNLNEPEALVHFSWDLRMLRDASP